MKSKMENNSQSESDFENVVEISVGKKQKTLYDFDDFGDINIAKTKKSFDSNLQHSQNNSNTDPDIKRLNTNLQKTGDLFRSPKFGDGVDQETNSVHGKTHQQFTLRPTNNPNNLYTQKNVIPSSILNFVENELPQFKKPSKPTKPKKTSYIQKGNQNRQIQYYQNLISQINYYTQSTDNIVFQNKKLYQSIQDMKIKLTSRCNNQQTKQVEDQIKDINFQIEQQRSIQKKMGQVYFDLQQEYQQLANSINSMNFLRPPVLNNEVKAIIQQINSLKAQFDAYNRDQGSLNLSATMQQPSVSPQLSLTDKNQLRFKNDRTSIEMYERYFGQVYDQQKISEDPKFLFNLKMACLKQQWSIFNNSLIQINVSYRFQNTIILIIGNKMLNDLNKFSIYQDKRKIIQDQILAGRSYYTHKINRNRYDTFQPFIHIQIKYSNAKFQMKEVRLFIPNMALKYGEFIPFTKKQFDIEMKLDLPQLASNFRPIDKQILKSLNEISLFIPNLLFSRDGYQCQGIVKFKEQNGSLIQIKEKDQLIRIWGKNTDIGVIKTLEFLFTL